MLNRRGFFLPAGFFWYVGAVLYTTALGWYAVWAAAKDPIDHWF